MQTLNLFAFPTYTALNGGIDASNLNIQYYTFSLTGSSTATSNTVKFLSAITGIPHGVTLMQVQITGAATPTFVSGAVCISDWSYNGTQISINAISGLSDSTTYTLTVKVE